ncbi:hypothetical protein ACWHLZ_27460 [Streptomyces chartreusis]|uniref:hypothetical protein n=1 Tax=Streptomyces chartreusis TaxID=1969 RepID=UPI002F90B2CC|nr:hypothetical protein OG938_01255 [Streptomyces chartreusis]WTA32507.1 hypothetical protein OIA45_41370 [Streptomyces chartreusis]
MFSATDTGNTAPHLRRARARRPDATRAVAVPRHRAGGRPPVGAPKRPTLPGDMDGIDDPVLASRTAAAAPDTRRSACQERP